MSTEQYGIVGSMQVLINVLVIFFSLGAEKSIFRLYHDCKNDEERKTFLSTVSWFIYVFAAGMVCVMLLLHNQMEKIYTSIPFSPYFIYAIGIAFVTEFEVAPRIYLQVTAQSKKYLCFSLLQMSFSAIGILYFVVYKHQEAVGMLKGMLVAQAGMLPFYIGIHIRNFNVMPKLSLMKSIFSYCLPLLPSVIAAWIVTMSSQIFIEHNFSTKEVAVYSLALKIVGIVTVVASAVMTAYKPIFYRFANSENQTIAKQTLFETQNKIILVLIVFTGFIAVFSKDIITILFRDDYNDAMFLIPILVIGTTMSKISGYTNLAFYQDKKTLQIMWIMILASIVSIGMNYFIIPKYSMFGAAFSYLVATSIFFTLKYIMSKPYYFIPFDWLKMLMCSAIMIALYFVNTFLLPTGIVPALIKFTLCMLAIIFILHKTKLITFKV